MKRLITMIMALTLILGTATISYADYTDVKASNWAHDAIIAMSDGSVISGYPDGSFQPGNTITYGEFIKMALVAGTGEDVGNAATGHWASNYYDKAQELGYFTRYDIDKANLDKQITRAHMALITSAVLGDVKISSYDEIQKGITDVTYKTKYEYDITKAYATGILTGYPDNTFKPEKTLTRAEAATVIYRLVDESRRVLPDIGKETTLEQVRTVTASTAGGTLFETTLRTGRLGDSYGIVSFEIVQYGYIRICSTVKYDNISLVIENKLVRGFGNPDGGNYWIEDGYYVYYSEPGKDGIDVRGRKLAVYATIDARTGENTGIIELPDAAL